MGHIALYREWRPKTFDEVVEQHYTVAALKQAVISGQIGHAYLFSGTRGTGKTTMAQIFSRAVNCLAPESGNPCNKCDICKGILSGSLLDVIEMDAASNNNVDTIRRMCDEVIFSPSVARFKVYIIDEVHMLSTGAFNALLKTLEEPPAHAVFILATTEPHRIPATILSRCQRYEFRRIPVSSIVERLRLIAGADDICVDESALALIARIADGALRDAISLLDQAKGSFTGTIGKDDILSLVGMVNDDFMFDTVVSLITGDPGKLMMLIDELIMQGRDVNRFTSDLALFFRNIMICKVSSDPTDLISLSDKAMADLKDIAGRLSLDQIISFIKKLSSVASDLKWSLNPRVTLEASLIQLMDIQISEPASTVSDNKTEKSVDEESKVSVLSVSAAEVPGNSDSVNWLDILERVAEKGFMTLYLFLRPAKVKADTENIDIHFSKDDFLNYNEVSKASNVSAISAAVREIMGREININISLEQEAAIEPVTETSATPQDRESLRRSVEELGIAFYMED